MACDQDGGRVDVTVAQLRDQLEPDPGHREPLIPAFRAALPSSEILSEIWLVPTAASCTLREISPVAELCCCTAEAIAVEIWLICPIVAPMLGGYIVETASWQWIFYINVLPGVASALIVGTSPPALTLAFQSLMTNPLKPYIPLSSVVIICASEVMNVPFHVVSLTIMHPRPA